MNKKVAIGWIGSLVLPALLIAACTRPAGPGDVYLSTTGSNANDCLTPATACATINAALGVVRSGGVIHVAAGDYHLTGDVDVRKSVTFRGDDRDRTRLFGWADRTYMFFVYPSVVSFDTLTISGADGNGPTARLRHGIEVGEGAVVSINNCLLGDFRNSLAGYAVMNRGGVLVIGRSRFQNNRVGVANGGLSAHVAMTITDSDFDRNETGVLNMSDPDRDRAAQLTDVRFTGNTINAINNGGSMRLSRAQLDRNGSSNPNGSYSAAIVNYGRMTILGPTTIQGSPAEAIMNGPDRPAMLSLIGVTILGTPTSFGVEQRLGHMSISGSVISAATIGLYHVGGDTLVTSSVIEGSRFQGILIQIPSHPTVIGSVTIRRSAVIRSAGTGIALDGMSLLLENSTVSGNGLSFQSDPRALGGIYVGSGASLTMTDSTVASNTGEGLVIFTGGRATVRRSILVANSQVECEAPSEAGAADFDDRGFACDDTATLASLGLGPLTEMAGTFVHPILDPASPLVDTAGTGCSSPDQVGTVRPQLAGCDFGAFELPAGTMSLEITPIPFSTITPAPAAGPVFTFTQQANCRKGPNTLYESLGFGQIGDQVPIQGLSDPLGWYYVQLPNGARCFAAGSTGDVSGLLDGLPVIPAPPLPVATSTLMPPAAPTLSLNNQVCDATQYVVRLSWNNVEGEDGYRVYRDGGLIATLGANATVYDDVSPDYNAHAYRVESFNTIGVSSSASKNSEGCLY